MKPLSNIESPEAGRRNGPGILVWMTVLWACPGAVFGQTPGPAAPAPAAGGRGLALEYVVVVVMIGLALFAVCRSSRRN